MSSTNRNERTRAPSLMPTRYDRVASLLISMLVLSSASVAVLFVVWLGAASVNTIDESVIGRGVATAIAEDDSASDFETPESKELPESFDNAPLALSNLLSADAVAAAINIDTNVKSRQSDVSKDARSIGDLQKDVVPRWERWDIRYTVSNLQAYAKQLDFFGIELGAAGGGQKNVDYASKLSAKSPVTRSAAGDKETRLYLTWRGGKLASLDRKLLSKAGIDVDGRIVMQFYPQKVEDALALMESKHREDGRVDKIRKTIFGVRPSKEGYEFYIIEQT